MGDVTDEQIAQARQAGHDAAVRTAGTAPTEPLLRVAWALGFGQVDQIQLAFDYARSNGTTWKQLAQVTGENWRTTQTKWGGGRRRQREYQRRKRGEG